MLNKLLLLCFFIAGCGKNVQLKTKLNSEKSQQITEADMKKYEKLGTLDTTNQVITYQGQTFKIGAHSSYQAKTFIKSMPSASLIPVKFRAGINGQELDIEVIERQ